MCLETIKIKNKTWIVCWLSCSPSYDAFPNSKILSVHIYLVANDFLNMWCGITVSCWNLEALSATNLLHWTKYLFGKIIFTNLFYYSAYFYYYSLVPRHFLVLFMNFTVLFQLIFTFIYNIFNKKLSVSAGAAWCIWGPNAKIDHLVLNAKLLLININYVKKKKFRNFIDRKNLTKFFILVDDVD